MNYTLKFLREELNRERSYANRFYIDEKLGRRMTSERISCMFKKVNEGRIPSIETAIAFLKKKPVKPEYRWTPGEQGVLIENLKR